MDNVKIKEEFIKNGLCEKWAERWRDDWTKQSQLDALMSLDGMDFLAKKHFPSTGQLLRHFDGMLEKSGLYIKKIADVELVAFTVKVHFVACTCDVKVPDNHVGFIYVSNGSRVRLFIGDNCDCRIVCYEEDSMVSIEEIGRNSIAPIEYKKNN